MKQILPIQLRLYGALLAVLFSAAAQTLWGQCNNGAAFGTFTAPTTNTPLPMSTCIFGGEYNTINGAVAGSTYQFTGSGGAGNYLTVRQGSPSGTVLAFGFSPISATCTVSGPIYLHVNTTAACGTDGTCHSTTMQCTSCPGASDPCTVTTPISCGTSTSVTLSGGGLWNPGSCGFNTPGAEKIYTFTPSVTGVHNLQVTSTSSTGYIDYFIKSAAGGCSSTGWTCIDDIFSATTVSMGNLTAGQQYYVLLDAEVVVSISQTFQINCPVYNPCASTPTITCGASTTITSVGTGVWSPGTCGFATPGQEKLYVFTPLATGMHTLQITAASGGYVDYFFKPVSGGCNATGWTCIGDANAPESNAFGPLTAGVPYYIMMDPEPTSSVSQSFQINCPAAPPACLASPTSPTNGQTNICPSPSQTLSWAAVPGATSYDVYFGTTAIPPFVANTAGTSLSVATPSTGIHYWQILPRNAAGAATGCAIWSFTKVDVTPPTIICPPNATINNTNNLCTGVLTYGAISASDLCSAPAISLVSGPASGTTQPVGAYPIVYRATDNAGNSATCSFTVTIRDAQPPTITCPANIVKSNTPNLCYSITTYNAPTTTDNCSVVVSLQSGLPSGAAFPVGITTNVLRATDPGGNFATCSFTVRVNDVQLPVVTCPAALTLFSDPQQCGRAVDWVGQASASDNCGIAGNTNNNPGYLPVGEHFLIHTVTDVNNNQTTCSQKVTIKDGQPPHITCPSNITVFTDDFDCIATINYSVDAGDNCPNYVVEYTDPPSSAFSPGITTVKATVTDASGFESSCTFKVRVNTRTEICNDYDDDCDGITDETDDWSFVAKLFAPDGTASDQYGGAVDIDGDYAIASSLDGVYILQRGSNGWAPATGLVAAGVQPGDEYGASVAVDSNFAVVGSPGDDGQGSAYVFVRDANDNWTFASKLTAGAAGDRFGHSVDIDNGRVLVGANQDDASGLDAGAAYIFDTAGVNLWTQTAKLLATTGNAGDNMGASVSLNGNQAAVGATGVDGFYQNSGAAYVFGRNQNGPNAWGQIARMRSQQSKDDDNFGASVGISGRWVIVGASRNDLQGNNAGAAFLYYRDANGINDSWGQRFTLRDFGGTAGENYGNSVAVQGNYAVVGAKNDNPYGSGSGRVFVYERQPDDNWLLLDQPADVGGQINDNLGADVAISGSTIMAGVPGDDNGTVLNQGAAAFFEGVCADELRQISTDRNEALASNVRTYPVPFSEVLNIDLVGIESDNVQIQVVNGLGQLVADIHNGAVRGDLTIQWRPDANLADGIYFLRLRTDGKITTQMVVLSRQR